MCWGFLAVGSVGRNIGGQLGFPAVAVREQLFLVVEEFLTGFRGELEIRTFDDRIYGAGLLAQTAIDALRHVDIVAGRPAAAIVTRLGLDRDGQRRANSLAQLTGDAALFPVGITAQGVLAAEPRADGPFLER